MEPVATPERIAAPEPAATPAPEQKTLTVKTGVKAGKRRVRIGAPPEETTPEPPVIVRP